MSDNEGKWHDTLNQLRNNFRLYMDGEVAQQQRDLGLDYGINFGITTTHLKQISQTLPKDSSLADLMWSKDVREMKLLALLIFPPEEMTDEHLLQLCRECTTREVAEQLVMSQLRIRKSMDTLVLKVFELGLPDFHPAAVIPYLMLIQLANKDTVSLELMNQILPRIQQDLTSENSSFLTSLNHCLLRLSEEQQLRPALMHISSVALSSLPDDAMGYTIAENLKEYLLEL